MNATKYNQAIIDILDDFWNNAVRPEISVRVNGKVKPWIVNKGSIIDIGSMVNVENGATLFNISSSAIGKVDWISVNDEDDVVDGVSIQMRFSGRVMEVVLPFECISMVHDRGTENVVWPNRTDVPGLEFPNLGTFSSELDPITYARTMKAYESMKPATDRGYGGFTQMTVSSVVALFKVMKEQGKQFVITESIGDEYITLDIGRDCFLVEDHGYFYIKESLLPGAPPNEIVNIGSVEYGLNPDIISIYTLPVNGKCAIYTTDTDTISINDSAVIERMVPVMTGKVLSTPESLGLISIKEEPHIPQGDNTIIVNFKPRKPAVTQSEPAKVYDLTSFRRNK